MSEQYVYLCMRLKYYVYIAESSSTEIVNLVEKSDTVVEI